MAENMSVGLLLMFLGLYMIIPTILRWKWFWDHPKILRLRGAGDKTATIALVISGAVCLVLGVLVMTDVLPK